MALAHRLELADRYHHPLSEADPRQEVHAWLYDDPAEPGPDAELRDALGV